MCRRTGLSESEVKGLVQEAARAVLTDSPSPSTALSLYQTGLTQNCWGQLYSSRHTHYIYTTHTQHNIPTTAVYTCKAKVCHSRSGISGLPGRLGVGCAVLDSRLRGGLLVPGLTEIAGTSAAGKTQLCLQLCLTCQLPRTQGGLATGLPAFNHTYSYTYTQQDISLSFS